ncbi:MAG TPA: hypothetical protein VFP01_06100, partial [Propionibacteriaceae bacterium]|nr:hypothetical protein [Propionibacteriaceae bacterium]
RATAGDAIWLKATVDRIADILARQGDTDPVDVAAPNPRWLAGPATRIRHLAVAIAPAPHLSGQRHGHPPLGDTEFAEAIWHAAAGPLQKLASRPDQSRFSSCPAAAEFADNL